MMITPEADNQMQGQLRKNMLNSNMREVGVSQLISENIPPKDATDSQQLKTKHPEVNVNGSNVNRRSMKKMPEGDHKRNNQGIKTNTITSFKTIIINNPWEQNQEASEDQR